MQLIFFVGQIAIFFFQVSAGMEGMHLYFGVGTFASFALFFVAYAVPVVGSILGAVAVYYGAHVGWHWDWWQAAALAAPGIIFMLTLTAMGGLASVFGGKVE